MGDRNSTAEMTDRHVRLSSLFLILSPCLSSSIAYQGFGMSSRCLSPLMVTSELKDRFQSRRGSYRQGEEAPPSGVTACLKSDSGKRGLLSTHSLYEHDGNIGQKHQALETGHPKVPSELLLSAKQKCSCDSNKRLSKLEMVVAFFVVCQG